MMEPLPPLLERTSAILADSARLLLEIEDIITPLLAPTPHRSTSVEVQASFRASVVSLQKIDLLSQTLEDLSFWLDDLAGEARLHVTGQVSPKSAMTRLRLADLRQRLHGHNLSNGIEDRSQPVLF